MLKIEIAKLDSLSIVNPLQVEVNRQAVTQLVFQNVANGDRY